MYTQNRRLNKSSFSKVVIIFVLSLFVMTLTGCDSGLDYSDFEQDHILGMDNIIEQGDSQYLVYYYGANCSHCTTIKEDVLNFALSNDADIKVYFIVSASDTNSDIENDPSYITDPVTGNPMTGTPTMISVVNRRVVDLNVGPTVITDLLEKIEEGSYGIFE